MAGSEPEWLSQSDLSDVPGLIRSLGAEPGRRLSLPGTLNFRDVGGYPAAAGTTIGRRRLLRSDALHRLDSDAVAMLSGLGLRTVVDLRTHEETEIAPSPLGSFAERGIRVTQMSLIGENFAGLPLALDDVYQFIVDQRGPAIAAAVRVLAGPRALPALVHCAAGKDRTGIVVALVLAAAGVPDKIIAADYALSRIYLDPATTAAIGRVRDASGLGEQLTEDLMASPPELILAVLDRVREQAGTVEAYLTRHGVTAAELGALRAALVEVPAAAKDRESG
jgi:protein-tyrosine phosphatase